MSSRLTSSSNGVHAEQQYTNLSMIDTLLDLTTFNTRTLKSDDGGSFRFSPLNRSFFAKSCIEHYMYTAIVNVVGGHKNSIKILVVELFGRIDSRSSIRLSRVDIYAYRRPRVTLHPKPRRHLLSTNRCDPCALRILQKKTQKLQYAAPPISAVLVSTFTSHHPPLLHHQGSLTHPSSFPSSSLLLISPPPPPSLSTTFPHFL